MNNIGLFKSFSTTSLYISIILTKFYNMCPLLLRFKHVFVVKHFFARCPFLLQILHVGEVGEGKLLVEF